MSLIVGCNDACVCNMHAFSQVRQNQYVDAMLFFEENKKGREITVFMRCYLIAVGTVVCILGCLRYIQSSFQNKKHKT